MILIIWIRLPFKNGKRIQTHCGPLYAQTRCRPVHARRFTAGQKTVENQDWASGPPGHRRPQVAGRWAVTGRGPWAAGPPGRRAAGLLLAKPENKGIPKLWI